MPPFQHCVTPFGVFDLSTHEGQFCPYEHMTLTLGEVKYPFEKETASALTVLNANPDLWPAIVCFPSALTPSIVFFHVTFPKFQDGRIWAKGEARRDLFLSKNLLDIVRKYNVKSVIVGKQDLVRDVVSLREPRLDNSVFEVFNLKGEVRPVSDSGVLSPRQPPRVLTNTSDLPEVPRIFANTILAENPSWISRLKKTLGLSSE